MMHFIEIDEKKCDRCFKCLRGCPTKAIAFTDSSHHIVNALCVKCGWCQLHCPKQALTIQSDLTKVLRLLHAGIKVAVSLAPSYTSAFDVPPQEVIRALYRLGFSYVEETAIAAEWVSLAYESYIVNKAPANLITTCCPSANLYIEQRYPSLLPLLAPVVSPMILHGRMLKEKLGSDYQVVFIGPCLAKKAEACQDTISDSIDYVLTFNAIASKLDLSGIGAKGLNRDQLERGELATTSLSPTLRGAAYPMGSSLFDRTFTTLGNVHYRHISAEGIEQLDDLLSSFSKSTMTGYCAEVNMCHGSCINGPDMPHQSMQYYLRLDQAKSHLEQLKRVDVRGDDTRDKHTSEAVILVDMHGLLRRGFEPRPQSFESPNPMDIKEVLVAMNKFTDDDLLNCGACGYNRCEDKAIAILRGHAVKSMCLPYMKSIVDGLSYAIYDQSPNPICIIDERLRFSAYNKAFARDFSIKSANLKGKSCDGLIPESLFKQNEMGFTGAFTVDYIDKSYVANTLWLADQKAFLCILTDVSHSESQKEALQCLKKETLKSCESVINQQMTMVQEVAGMLGESVAHSKLQLDQLKRLIEKEARESYDGSIFP